MRLWMAWLAVAPACGFRSQPSTPTDGQVAIDAAVTIDGAVTIDAAVDAAIPPDAQACFGTLARV